MDAELDYRRLFECAPVALLAMAPDLTIVAVSDYYLTTTGVSREMLLGRKLFDVFPDDPTDPDASGVDNVGGSLRRVREQLAIEVMPIQKYAVAGHDDEFTNRYWAVINAPVLGIDGDLTLLMQRADDVTEYVRAKLGDVSQQDLADALRPTFQAESGVFTRQRLQEQNQTLMAVLNSLDTAVVGCDREGRAVLTNRSARELFALPDHTEPVDHWARRYSGFVFSDAVGNVLAHDDLPTQMLLRGEPVHNMLIVAKADGVTARTLRIHGEPVTDGGQLAAVIAVHEITRAKRAEKLKECERLIAHLLSKPEPPDHLLKQAVEHIGDMLGWTVTEFWTVDAVGEVLRRKALWSGTGDNQDLPDRLHKGIGIPGKAWAVTDPIWTTNLAADPAALQQTAQWLPLRSALAVPLPSGNIVLGVLVCYSDNFETPDDMRTAVMTGIAAHLGEFLERRRAEQYAAELEATRDEYIALVGHELRTPLTAIQAYTDMMRTDPGLSAEERGQMLDVMHRRATDLHTLIAKLLDVAGTRSGHIALQPRRMDLAEIAREAADNARAGNPAANVDLTALPLVPIDGDPERLREVIDELLRNALTWAPPDSTVGIVVHADEDTAVLSVTNTGARIPADEHVRIFDLFYRTGDSLHHGLPGTGLGLTLARAIIEQHGGNLTVSEPDEAATTFTIYLPAGSGTTHHPAHTPGESLSSQKAVPLT
ncbi:PAS domain-containing sensor histidine kinase [Winogradskya humida]|uniref:Sensor-like histidine kinase SenX3 n=1 Tax=Winogradskya humida TaxID=113566 RepID=A0ABQ3ZJ33_9ACTN|nr:ATP-binding protein [Actinoplanes humidus]GIE18507.1 hypothetical protein Ahu01nite_016090 [Actinoplanes humidus]